VDNRVRRPQAARAATGGSSTLPGMTRLTVNSPTELISALPYLIGFHPADSIAVVAMRDRRVLFAGRHDLPAPGDPPSEALHLAAVVSNQEADSAVVLGYGDPVAVTPAVRHAADALDRAGVRVLDVLRVTDGRFWTYRRAGEHGWPEGGRPCDPAHSAFAAAATFAGQVALPDRASLVAQLAPVTGDQRAAMTAATGRAQARIADLLRPATDFERLLRRAGRAAVRGAERRYRAGGRLLDDEVAWLGLLLVDLPVRDYAWQRAGGTECERRLWADVLRRVEPAYVPAPAALLAFTAWQAGLGALARAALDRALAEDPEYQMAQTIHEALVFGLSPTLLADWPALNRADFTPDDPDPAPGRAAVGPDGNGPGQSADPALGAVGEPDSGAGHSSSQRHQHGRTQRQRSATAGRPDRQPPRRRRRRRSV
jgi:hypothetical protein